MMKLTPLENEIYEHRLSLTDCLQDAFFDCEEDEQKFTQSEFDSALEKLQSMAPELPDEPSDCEKQIIADCLEGSTFMQAVDCQHDESPETLNSGKRLAYHKAAKSLQAKVAKVVGFEVELTMH